MITPKDSSVQNTLIDQAVDRIERFAVISNYEQVRKAIADALEADREIQMTLERVRYLYHNDPMFHRFVQEQIAYALHRATSLM